MSLPDFEDLRKTQTVFSAVAAHAPFGQIVIANGVGEKAARRGGQRRLFFGARDPARGRPAAAARRRPARRAAGCRHRRADVAPPLRRPAGHRRTGHQDGGPRLRDRRRRPAGFHGVELPESRADRGVGPAARPPACGACGAGTGDRPMTARTAGCWAQGRLAPGRTLQQAQAELRVIGRRSTRRFRSDAIFRELAFPSLREPSVDRAPGRRPSRHRAGRSEHAADGAPDHGGCDAGVAGGVHEPVEPDAGARRIAAARPGRPARARRIGWQVVREQLVESAIIAGLGALRDACGGARADRLRLEPHDTARRLGVGGRRAHTRLAGRDRRREPRPCWR